MKEELQGICLEFRMQDPNLSWTDDLPVCHLSGVGLSTNQIYREDGNRREAHDNEDRNFHFRHDRSCFLYGVFDGHNGSRVADFAAQRMPAELLLGQLRPDFSDTEVKEVLRQAFISVEKAYFESMDIILAKKAIIQDHIPEGISEYEAYNKFPGHMNQLAEIDKEISGGTTATIVLIYNDKLYVANVGDSRAFLCKTELNGVLRVIQLSYDHTISDPGEQTRLQHLGLDINTLKALRKVGNSDCTRCIGDYHMKGGYKDNILLSAANVEPVIADPFVDGGIQIDSSCAFLVIMSDGLYQALTDATGTETVNGDLAKMVAQEFSQQTTLNGVAQAVVDKVVRIHHDTFMTGSQVQKVLCQKRDDMTLLVRNFNYPLSVHSPSSARSLISPSQPPAHNFPSAGAAAVPNNTGVSPTANSQNGGFRQSSNSPATTGSPSTPTNYLLAGPSLLTTGDSSVETQTNTSSTYSTNSSGDMLFSHAQSQNDKLELDADGKVKAYVSFSEWYSAIETLTEEMKDSLYKELLPKSIYDPIHEEPSVEN